MRTLLRSVTTVIAAQPFYADEFQALQMALQACRHWLPIHARRPIG